MFIRVCMIVSLSALLAAGYSHPPAGPPRRDLARTPAILAAPARGPSAVRDAAVMSVQPGRPFALTAGRAADAQCF
jgi:hypothetical protein